MPFFVKFLIINVIKAEKTPGRDEFYLYILWQCTFGVHIRNSNKMSV